MNNNTLLNYLKLNAFFVRLKNFHRPHFDNFSICMVPTSSGQDVEERASLDNLTINKGITRTGQVFYTTPYGLVLLIDIEVKADMVYNIGDIWTVYPRETLYLIEKNVLPLIGRIYSDNARTISQNDLEKTAQKYKENREKEEAEKQKFLSLKEKFFSFIVDNQGPELLAERLWNFDIFYGYSDDINVYRAGLAKEKALVDELTSRGFDGNAVMKMIVQAKTKK